MKRIVLVVFDGVKIGINEYLEVKIYPINATALVTVSRVAFVYSGNYGHVFAYNTNIDFQDFNILGHYHTICFRIH